MTASIPEPMADPAARGELLLAARAAMRALPEMYAARNAGAGDDVEVFAAELFCLLGLYDSIGPGSARDASREQVAAFAGRVLESLFAATNRVRDSWTTVAAFAVRHGVVHGPSRALTDQVVNTAWYAMTQVDQDLAESLKQHAAADRVALGVPPNVRALAASPLCNESDTDRIVRLIEAGQFGRDRLRGWYGLVLRGREWFIQGVGELVAEMIDRVGPPGETPGETAVYVPAEVLMHRTVPLAAAAPPPPPDDAAPLDGSEATGASREVRPASDDVNANAAPDDSGDGGDPGRGVNTGGEVLLSPPIVEEPLPDVTGERIVNTGFALPEYADLPHHQREPLRHQQDVLFWLEVGKIIAGSIETTPTSIDWDKLPPDAVLTVALFGFDDGLEIRSGTGAIRLAQDGRVVVDRQPDPPSGADIPADLLEKRLFFMLRTPRKGTEVRLRCNIYCKQVLVQSRQVTAKLNDREEFVDGALTSTLDYNLTRSLRGSMLGSLGEHRLSVMLNHGTDGSHKFRFFGSDGVEFINEATFGENELSDLLEQGRGALRLAAWGSDREWTSEPYRYANEPPLGEIEKDLIKLAVTGFRFYDLMVERLSRRNPERLEALMRRPGLVQFTARRSARELVPASLIYDRALDTGAAALTLCPEFRDALQKKRALELEPCFLGDCPNAGNDAVVCPGGFWGFRHDLGIPISLAADGSDVDGQGVIPNGAAPAIDVCVSTDPAFVRRAGHQDLLHALFPGPRWSVADTREGVKKLLARSGSQIIYFYCHGGLKGTTPYILVGKGPGITRDNIRGFKWNWRTSRPLVFINGCHTSALQPSHAFDLVTGFIETAGASGVIGTEITVFEPLACAFGEAFMDHFVNQRKAVGESVRLARLRLLQAGNPLGLAYIPFAVASLKLA